MTLEAGTRLGPYEIVSPLGKGGMGEVYKARDTRLEREVAIKVLPTEWSGDPRFKERLEREAKKISQLQHHNVCTLYDVGSQGGVDYLVMEYLHGETVESRLNTRVRCRSRRFSRSGARSPRRSRRRTGAGSSTATSSPAT